MERDDNTAACYFYRLLLRLNPLNPPTTFLVVPMQTPPKNRIATTTRASIGRSRVSA